MMNYLALQSDKKTLRLGARIAMGLCVMAVLASYSRGSFLALGAMVVFLGLHSHHKLVRCGNVVVAVPLDQFHAAAMDRSHLDDLDLRARLSSTEGRIDIWRAAAKIAVARPLVGGGFMAPYDQDVLDVCAGHQAKAVHWIWFEILGENGFIAFGLWFAIAVIALQIAAISSGAPRGA